MVCCYKLDDPRLYKHIPKQHVNRFVEKVIRMKNIYLAVMLLLFQSAFSQAEEQEKINKDVWLNFMQAYQDLDASLFNEIHTGEVLRVPAD